MKNQKKIFFLVHWICDGQRPQLRDNEKSEAFLLRKKKLTEINT